MTTLITGANRGIGRALLKRLSEEGADLIATCRRTPPPDLASRARWFSLDVTSPEDQCSLAGALADAGLDLLIVNAGVYLDKGQPLDTGFAKPLWDDTFAVNVTGAFHTIQSALPAVRRAKGKIAIIASQMGSSEKAPGGSYVYRASKAAAINLGRNLATDLRSDGIAVGIYHPGWVRTDMGGGSASISPEESAAGLVQRFDELSLATTGAFLTWDGTPHPL